jgi:hypothetical protein
MNGYSDLMMAVVIASTALIGLSGVIWAQLRFSAIKIIKERVSAKVYRQTYWLIFTSIVLGLVAVLFALLWFATLIEFFLDFAPFMCFFQILSFSLVWLLYRPHWPSP